MEIVMPGVAELQGLWQRSLVAWPDGRRDTTTAVRWMQGQSAYVDLRQPASIPDFSQVRCLDDLSREHCQWLARQQGFAGRFTSDGRYFEWHRSIDYQPKGRYADAGTLQWEGDVLVERGRDVDYLEHWHRDPLAVTLPVAAAVLQDTRKGTQAVLVRVGATFMLARDRATVLPPLTTLAECVEGAATLQAARALLDCEISFGTAAANGFRISASTLPHRIGDQLRLDEGWKIIGMEGELDALSPTGIPTLHPL
jgi:hypothetical protein